MSKRRKGRWKSWEQKVLEILPVWLRIRSGKTWQAIDGLSRLTAIHHLRFAYEDVFFCFVGLCWALLGFVCLGLYLFSLSLSLFSFSLSFYFNFLSAFLQLRLTISPLSTAAGLRKNRFRKVNLIWSVQRLKLASYWFSRDAAVVWPTVKWPTTPPPLSWIHIGILIAHLNAG